MVVKICPRCKQRYSVNRTDVDFIHTCNSGNLTIDEEDTVDITQVNWNLRGFGNALRGTTAELHGAKTWDYTDRGNRADIVKTERHEEYIQLE